MRSNKSKVWKPNKNNATLKDEQEFWTDEKIDVGNFYMRSEPRRATPEEVGAALVYRFRYNECKHRVYFFKEDSQYIPSNGLGVRELKETYCATCGQWLGYEPRPIKNKNSR